MARFYEKLTKPTALADGDIFVISVGSGTSWIDYKITYSQLKDVIKTISDMQNYYTKSQTYTKTETDNAIAAAVSSTYKFAGSKTCAELVSSLLVAANKGNVYNMTDSGTTTSDFVEGAGHEINVGDNVGIAEVSAGVYKFDLLSGLIDLTGYQTKNLASAIEGQTTVEGALAALSANKANLSEVYTKTQINDDFVKKSATAGLLKNDGSVDTNTYVPAVTGKGLSTEDYTSLEKSKLAGISDGATKTESSLTNGHIEIDDVDVTVYDDTALDSRVDVVEQDLSTDTATVTGNPLNFTTLSAQKAKETVISLEPIQDLHGYDHPWPAGGGKNKLQINVPEGEVSGIASSKVYDNAGNAIGVRLTGNSGSDTVYRSWTFNLPAGSYIYDSGYADDQASSSALSDSMIQLNDVTIARGNNATPGHNFTIAEDSTLRCLLRIRANRSNVDVLYQPMIRLATETDPTFAPYSNYCPIDGRTETSLVGTNGKESTDPDYVESNNLTISFGEKVYGAKVELEKGTVTVEWGYIASYNGETLPGEWISDRDVYAPNTSPSTGAEVVYELATPRTIQLTPNEISLLEGVNNISTDGDGITLTYRDGKVATLGDLDGLVKKIADCEDVEITDLQAGDSLVWDATAGKWKNQQSTSMVVYDDTEQVIGTWFGETLYQKSFRFTPSSLDEVIDISTLGIKDIISGVGYWTRYSGNVYTQYPLGDCETPSFSQYDINVRYEVTNGNLRFIISGYGTVDVNQIRYTIQYTKTTPTLLMQSTEESTPADESTDENR